MKKIPIDQCLQCWHFDDDTYHCRQTGERLMNPYVIPTNCPLPDDLPESKDEDYEPYFGWCDVEGCDRGGCSGGNAWRETGYWTVCPVHAEDYRKGMPQPKMKQEAIDRENSRDPITHCLPAPPTDQK